MTDLSFSDRFYRGFARFVQRPVLHVVTRQQILRRIFAVTAPLASKIPPGTKIRRDRDGSVRITPPGVAPDAPLLLYIHGGGFTIGSPRTHAGLVVRLAQEAGMRALALRYPLAPEHPFPAAPDACLAAYRALVAAGDTPAAIAGDSAGGCLTLLTLQSARDAGLPLPKGCALIGPIGDLSADIAARCDAAGDEILIPPAWPRCIRRDYLPGIDPAQPAVSPLLGDLSGLPPTLIQAATGEALAEDATRIAAAMDRAELELWDDLQHVWHLHAGRARAANRALKRLGAFLAEQAV